MSTCLRCGAGNEWIEPIGREPVASLTREQAWELFLVGAENGGDPGTYAPDSAEIRASWKRIFDAKYERLLGAKNPRRSKRP